MMFSYNFPIFQNENGYDTIFTGSKKFICIGAYPPLDHPHIFLNIGNNSEIVCPYCSTIYKFRF